MNFHILLPNSKYQKFMHVSEYDIGGFDVTQFWGGHEIRGDIPSNVQLFVGSAHKEHPSYLGNPIRAFCCLDRNQSEVSYKADGTISSIQKYVFDAEQIPSETHIFRCSDYPFVVIFSDELAQSLSHKNLSGISFLRCESTGSRH